ncbi:MAG: hypothetical protein MUF50_03465 [Planctomycetes bacterium]|jgi:hypothetical protein|nr:hypothetical protein [Planctomycetota bacterium]
MENDKNLNSNNLDLDKYQDLGGISTKKLEFGLWVISHKRMFLRVVVIVLAIVAFGFLAYPTYYYAKYFLHERRQEKLSAQDLSAINITASKNVAQPLIVSALKTFTVNKKTDSYVEVENPNDKYFSYFSYCFMEGEKEIGCDSAFAFPTEKKYILTLAKEVEKIGSLSFKIKTTSWNRVDLHKYPNWPATLLEHTNFKFDNVKFSTGDSTGLSDKINLNLLEFSVVNNTAFSYWEVPLTIVLYSGAQVAGINHYVLEEFISGEKRNVQIVWPNLTGSVSDVKIFPNLDITSDGVYMKIDNVGQKMEKNNTNQTDYTDYQP